MRLRRAMPADRGAIRALLLEAFPGDAEAALVEALEASGDAVLGLVAGTEGGSDGRERHAIHGHLLLSRMASPKGALGLGPLATAPEARGRGIASALVREALATARGQGWQGVFVLGEPGFYRRFGFAAETAAPWSSPYAGACFLALELIPGALAGGGEARYAAPFAEL